MGSTCYVQVMHFTTRVLPRLSFLCGLALAGFACGSSSSTPTGSSGGGGSGGGHLGTGGTGGHDVVPTDPACDAFAASLQSGIDAARDKQKVKHAALGVGTPRCGKIIVYSDAASATVKPTPESLWQIGSSTKTFIAATVLNLAEAGELGVDDALADYLPDFPNAENITLRQLLNHTSGIFDYLQTPEVTQAVQAHPGSAVTADQLIAYATAHPPNFEPGKGWAYSNTNFIILGRVIEKATGADLGETVRARSIALAGLGHTFLASAEEPVGALVPGFQGGPEVTTLVNPTWFGTAGSMRSTVSDVLEWAEKLYGTDDVLSPAAKAEMTTTVATDVSYLRYGMGLVQWDASKTAGNGVAYGHFGFVPGYQTEFLYHPETKVAIVALGADSDAVPHTFTKLVYDALPMLK
ncbi:D-alanyl-D-alanine carboxypeptidase [Minicystis rosea]|nr:D-alanyl-D-alanine carboxypeptidase [Minicystis rosea]